MQISLAGARALLLAAQGLDQPHPVAGKEDVLASVRRMGALQIDTIHVVARSHLLVLWSRLGAFEPRWLDELLAEGALFEYWSHAACFLPTEDFRLYRPAMLHRRADSTREGWLQQHSEVAERVLERIRREGPVRAAEWVRSDGRAGEWWDRKPEKAALEELYNTGIVMIARREGFQRVYDLQERVLPGWSDGVLPSAEEIERELALNAVRALGVAPARWVPDYFRRLKRGSAALLQTLAAEGALVPVSVPDLGDEPAYVHPDHLHLAEAAAAWELRSSVTTLLSPFDPVVWDRARARELFGFEYRIEVYTPAERRKFGYFTLPILHRGALVGRLCPKAHRREGIFEVRQLHLEPGVTVTEEFIAALGGALHDSADWHGTPQVVIRQSDPPELAGAVQSAAAA
ncbi:MAG TPA: crosslink repair DNA glycosylase YcaQ family protein [Armatimonadota bacterium]|nr:crosslink repair DNA glycosylase YcaQ family protein [Armatimonadota bacterium]